MPVTLAVKDAVKLIPCGHFGNYWFTKLDGGQWRDKLLFPFFFFFFLPTFLRSCQGWVCRFLPLQPAHLLVHYNPWSARAWWLLRPFLLGSASWPKRDQERRSCTHACPYVSCFPLWNSIVLTAGIPWQSGQKLFSFLEALFWICLCFFLFFLSFSCPCSPCITTSK